MTTFNLHSHVGPDGILHLDIPLDLVDADLEVLVTVQPLGLTAADILARTAGSIPDLERPPQGDYDVREPL